MYLTPKKLLARLAIALACCAGTAALAAEADHREFEAMLHVPYKAQPPSQAGRNEARTITLAFEYPFVQSAQDVSWRVELLNPAGQPVRQWHGMERLFAQPVKVKLNWDGRADGAELPDGIYLVRMRALASDAAGNAPRADLSATALDQALAAGGEEIVEQSWEISVGNTGTAGMPAFKAMASRAVPDGAGDPMLAMAGPAPASLPYTVYLGNLHSQTNHSDGGGDLSTCAGAQGPQSGASGPTDGYTYAMNRGLDLLMASEHNHMYDGSSGTSSTASPAAAKALYQSGLTAAADFNAAHPNFLAVYGLEWGVISNGGHLNVFNTPELLGWELNGSGQLIGDTQTTKGDYAALYTLMRQRGWVGQFNHPASTGQFLVNGVPFGYTSDGDQAMVLCEVLNSSAFSTNTSETETGRSSYASGCNKALEAGYHIAFSSNQDNHCANWGASYTNRTGVLIPNGVPLSNASFLDALKARRVFASMDKNAQLVLTANGHIMGERFTNSGTLNLVANFASSTGMSVSSAVIYEGVPGRNGTVTQLASTADTTITPSLGEHFYYAKLTQSDGKILWSAPVWVTQSDSGDISAPSVTAGQAGSSGNITLSASASDNVGVTLVEFYVDKLLKASSNVAPYSATLDSTTLADGSHGLVAKAYDAAGNVGVSSPLAFSVSNSAGDTSAPIVSASASGSSGIITLSASASDNVGVSTVEFYVDSLLKGSDGSAPYALALDSTTLSNGGHTLAAKAFDAAGNNTLSSAVSFSIDNGGQQLIGNGGFESGSTAWKASSGVITSDATQPAHAGVYKAWLAGYGAAHTDTLYQQVAIPSSASSVSLSFWLKVVSNETTSTTAYDTLKVQVRNKSGAVLATLATYSNLDKGPAYVQKSLDLSAYKGQTVRIYFLGVEGTTIATSFLIDDVSLLAR